MASGSAAGLSLDGLPFDVAGDADLNEVFTEFTNTVIPTSGKGSISQEKRVLEVSGVVVIIKPGDKALLKDLSESGKELSMSYKHRDGTKYSGMGTFEVENNTTMQNRTSLKLMPTGKWTESI